MLIFAQCAFLRCKIFVRMVYGCPLLMRFMSMINDRYKNTKHDSINKHLHEPMASKGAQSIYLMNQDISHHIFFKGGKKWKRKISQLAHEKFSRGNKYFCWKLAYLRNIRVFISWQDYNSCVMRGIHFPLIICFSPAQRRMYDLILIFLVGHRYPNFLKV